jgi:hypothetical protein
VQVIPSSVTGAGCEDSSLLLHPVKEITAIVNRISETLLKRDIFTPTQSLLAVYWSHLTRLDLLRAPH